MGSGHINNATRVSIELTRAAYELSQHLHSKVVVVAINKSNGSAIRFTTPLSGEHDWQPNANGLKVLENKNIFFHNTKTFIRFVFVLSRSQYIRHAVLPSSQQYWLYIGDSTNFEYKHDLQTSVTAAVDERMASMLSVSMPYSFIKYAC